MEKAMAVVAVTVKAVAIAPNVVENVPNAAVNAMPKGVAGNALNVPSAQNVVNVLPPKAVVTVKAATVVVAPRVKTVQRKPPAS